MKALMQHKWMISLMLIFVIVFALISWVNHYQFRTYALDLGAYTNALFDYREGRFNDSAVFKEIPENLLSDHLDLYLVVCAPLSFVFGTYTLLIVQVLAIGFGGWGVYRYFLDSPEKAHLAHWAAVYFYGFFGVYGALSFDYHSNVVAACFIPWLARSARRKKIWAAGGWWLLVLLAKENMAMWLIFVCLGLAWENRRSKAVLRAMLCGSFLSAIAFVAITGKVMPALSNGGHFNHFRYQVLGSGFGDAIEFILTHPIRVLEVFFSNHLPTTDGDGIKMELHILLLLSGILLLIRKPAYLIMLIPVFFQKLYHDSSALWGIGLHYNIEFAPVLALGLFESIATIKQRLASQVVASGVLVSTAFGTVRMMHYTANYWEKPRLQFYKPWHYQREYNVNAVHRTLDALPKNAVVSAQAAFVPHLALRDRVYRFPIVRDAEYIVLSNDESGYPLSDQEFRQRVEDLAAQPQWALETTPELLIFRRLADETQR